MEDHRRAIDDPTVAVDDRGELRQLVDGVVMRRRADRCLDHRPGALVDIAEDRRDGDGRVIHLDRPAARIAGHPVAIRLHRPMDRMPPVARREAARSGGHHEACREPFEVPFERALEGLVEVVDVEDLGSLRRGIQAEVGQVRIAAQLDEDPARRPGRQVGRHRQGGTAIEGERRHRHPPVAHRDQLGRTRRRLPVEELDRVRPVGRRLPFLEHGRREAVAGGPSGGDQLVTRRSGGHGSLVH